MLEKGIALFWCKVSVKCPCSLSMTVILISAQKSLHLSVDFRSPGSYSLLQFSRGPITHRR
jgi:hypothetical protein